MKNKQLIAAALSIFIFAHSVHARDDALIAFKNGDFQEAKALFQKQNDSAVKSFYLGRISFNEKDFDLAEEYFENAVSTQPKNSEYLFWLGKNSLFQASNASIFTAPSYASAARDNLLKAHKLEPEHQETINMLIQFYLNVPKIAGGSIDKAIAFSEKLAVISPIDGKIAKLKIYREENNDESELKLAKSLMKEHDNSANALFAAGFSFQQHEKYDDAFKAFDKASRLKSDAEQVSITNSLYQYGKTAVLSESNTEKGIAAFESYLIANIQPNQPSKSWASYRLAMLYKQRGDLTKAKKHATLASLDKDDSQLQKRAKKLLKKLKRNS